MSDLTDPADINAFNQRLIEEFRANDGRLGGDFAGVPIVLVTMVGARSGKQRVIPLAYSRDGEAIVIIASKGGSPTHPDWYHNLIAHPEVTVELPGETYRATARVTDGDERDRLYRAQAALIPNFDAYAAATEREIPVFRLERIG